MRKKTEKIVNETLTAIHNHIKYYIRKNKELDDFGKSYIKDTFNELDGYISIDFRFGNMTENEMLLISEKVLEFKNFIYEEYRFII